MVLYCVTRHLSVENSYEDETSDKEERETTIEDRYRCKPLPRYALRHYDVTTSQLGFLVGYWFHFASRKVISYDMYCSYMLV